MDNIDYQFMRRAVDEAHKCLPEDRRLHPKVGVVVVRDNQILATSYRGEAAGNHAEYFALEEKLRNDTLAGATIYTTLEPCTTRNHPKIPCARRLVDRKVARVVIGMLDPNPAIVGRGQRLLRDANIATDFFPNDLMAEIEELNRDFIRSFNEARHFPGVLRPLGMKGLGSRATYAWKSMVQLARRWWITWVSSSKQDFVVDGLRLFAYAALFWGLLEAFGVHPLNYSLARLGISMPILSSKIFLVSAAFVLYSHTFIYPFFRKPSRWDVEYRNRKLSMTAALHNATACVQESISLNRLKNIERNALTAIKSYVEFTVSDNDGNNFCANLLVKHPLASGNLVCIRRTDAARGIPTLYDGTEMRRVTRTMETGETYYDGNYVRADKQYRMVWHVPVPSFRTTNGECVGLLCVDSRKPRHLNLLDERRSLLMNLSPYLSLLGFALAMRFEYNIWDSLE